MDALNNMRTRLSYNGGEAQIGRMNLDKLRSLKKALLYSYQSATAILSDGREFRCLINPDKEKKDYDDRILSIPFKDVCLGRTTETIDEETGEVQETYSKDAAADITSNGEEEIGVAAGDVFQWKENGTYWLVYLQKLEETAYFRAEIRRARYEVEIGDETYHVYASGPSEETLQWNKISGIIWNDIDYSLLMYITKDENTDDYLHRFKKLTLNNRPWEIQAVDNMSLDGVIIVALKEDYKNTIAETIEAEQNEDADDSSSETEDDTIAKISGSEVVYPYEIKTYSIVNAEGGSWSVSNEKANIIARSSSAVTIEIVSSRSGSFNLIYAREDQEDVVLPITIESL